MTEFGRQVRILRLQHGIQTKEMAAKLEISVPYLNSIENGSRAIPDGFGKKMAEKLELSEEEREVIEKSIILSKNGMKVDFQNMSSSRREVINTLVDKEIDEETIKKINALLKKKAK